VGACELRYFVLLRFVSDQIVVQICLLTWTFVILIQKEVRICKKSFDF